MVEGFNTAANHAYLLLFPVALDLWIWLGPHLYLKSILTQFFDRFNSLISSIPPEMLTTGSPGNPWGSPDMQQLVLQFQTTIIERLNLMFGLRTFPVGIPSVMSGLMPVATPWGKAMGIDLPSMTSALGILFLVVLVGMALGALFFQLVAEAAIKKETHLAQAVRIWPRQTFYMGLFSLTCCLIVLMAGVPFSCLASLIPGGIGSLAVFVYFGFLVFLLYPFVFTGHAIAADQDNIFTAILRSFRLARITLPLTALFFLGISLITQGLDVLWRVPAENSWLNLLAIGGHAFATTGLLAASFVYYRRATIWVAALFQPSASA